MLQRDDLLSVQGLQYVTAVLNHSFQLCSSTCDQDALVKVLGLYLYTIRNGGRGLGRDTTYLTRHVHRCSVAKSNK